MSQARGAIPILLATILGIGNGVWVFYPAFKEQQLEKKGLLKNTIEEKHPDQTAEVALELALKKAEAKSEAKPITKMETLTASPPETSSVPPKS